MTDLFPKCRRENCEESALSFSSDCWSHAEQGPYLSALHRGLDSADRRAPLVLNLKKAECKKLDFSNLDLRGSVFDQAKLTECHFIGVNLSDGNLIGANFTDCDFIAADLSKANLTRAFFTNSSFSYSDLRDTCLVEAHFRETDFMGAVMCGVNLWNADISGGRHIKKKNFKDPDEKTNFQVAFLSEADVLVAEQSYRSLKHYFYEKGLYEDGSWAAYRELTMERKRLFQTKDLRYIPSLLMDLLSGYTEKPDRVIVSALGIIFFFGLVYSLLGAIQPAAQPGASAGFWDSIYFSFVTFTTVGFGDFIPKHFLWIKTLVCIEAFSGPFMAGLYVFTLTRRYSAH